MGEEEGAVLKLSRANQGSALSENVVVGIRSVKKKEEPRGGGEGKQVRVSVEEQGPSLRALPASTLDFSLREKGKRWKF